MERLEKLERISEGREREEIRSKLLREYERRGMKDILKKKLWDWEMIQSIALVRRTEKVHFHTLPLNEDFRWVNLFYDLSTCYYDVSRKDLYLADIFLVYVNYGESHNLELRRLDLRELFCDLLEAYFNRPDMNFYPDSLQEAIGMLKTYRTEGRTYKVHDFIDRRDPRYLVTLTSRFTGIEEQLCKRAISFFMDHFDDVWMEELLMSVFLHYFKII